MLNTAPAARRLVALAAATTITLGTCLALVPADAHARTAPGAKKAVETVVPWSTEVACSVCHEDEAAWAQADTSAANPHTLLDCAVCHNQADALDALHATVTNENRAPTRLKKTQVEIAVCLTCHGDAPDADAREADEKASKASDAQAAGAAHERASAEKPADDTSANSSGAPDETAAPLPGIASLAASTTDCTTLTDANGVVVNPHSLPAVEAHAAFLCTDCHAIHDTGSDPSANAAAFCQTCHHANVYACFTCHEHG